MSLKSHLKAVHHKDDKNIFERCQVAHLLQVQRSTLLCAAGLVKFVPAVAELFCPALPGSFFTMFAQNKVDLCIREQDF